MSGPKRELPPIHIKITGDPSGGLKAIQDVTDAAKQAAKDAAAASKRQTKAAAKELDKQYSDVTKFYKDASDARKNYGKRLGFTKQAQSQAKQSAKAQEKEFRQGGKLLSSFAKTAKAAKSGMPDLNALVKNAEGNAKTQANNLAKANNRLATHVKNGAKIQAKQVKDAKAAQDQQAANLKKANTKLASQVKSGQKAQKVAADNQAAEDARILRRMRLRKRNRLVQQKKDAQDQADEDARILRRSRIRMVNRLKKAKADAEQQAKEDARVLRRQRMRERNRLQTRRDARQARVAGLRQQAGALRSQAMGAFSGGGMMGARADIYMHQETLKSMGAAIMDLVRPFAQVENYSIQMEAFAGSAEKAKDAIAQLQAYAVGSPYTLEGVLNASTVMMKYGAETEHAIKMTKLLGDVAAGDTHKLELMALAVGQAQALGRFQGQELRQMVNAGFNPLAIAAKEMAGPGADKAAIQKQMKLLQENMRAGALDSGIIEAALQIATSEGGDFAGLAYKQANTLTGLASQILETFDLFRIEIVKVFADDLTNLMKVTLQYVQALVEWAKNNKQAVKEWVNFIIQVAEAIALFSAAAMALAYLKWIMGSFIIVLGPIIFMMKLLTGTLSLLVGIWKIVGTAGMIAGIKTGLAWLAATAPIWGTALAIAAVIAAFAALWLLVEGFTSKRGFAGIFQDGMTAAWNFMGFMWNFGENFVNIFKFIGANWKLLVYDMLITNNPLIALARMGAKTLGMGDSFLGGEAAIRETAMGMIGGPSQLDTSMFKFGMPNIDTKSVLGSMDSMLGVSDALKPYLKPLDGAPTIGDKPNIDFSQFLGKGGSGGKGSGGSKPIDHAIRGSADHALRMYEYGESVRPAAADPKQQHQKKVEDLLGEIAKNTRGSAPMGPTMIEEAALA